MQDMRDLETGNNLVKLIRNSVTPRTYSCTSISDFNENKGDIKPTYFRLRPRHELTGMAIVAFDQSMTAHDVDKSNQVELSDMTGQVNALTTMVDAAIRSRNPSLSWLHTSRLYDVITVYDPNLDLLYLSSYSFDNTGGGSRKRLPKKLNKPNILAGVALP